MINLKIGRFAKINLYLHWTFTVYIIVIILTSRQWASILESLGMLFVIFLAVTMHEYAHALVARRFQIPTLGIWLTPIGGMAQLQEVPREPKKEFWISIAGPIFSFIFGAIGFVVMLLLAALGYSSNALALFVKVNFILGAFNLVPAFPLDGGRILRSILVWRANGKKIRVAAINYRYETWKAVKIALGLAVVMCFIGIVTGQISLILIAAFVVIAGRGEAKYA